MKRIKNRNNIISCTEEFFFLCYVTRDAASFMRKYGVTSPDTVAITTLFHTPWAAQLVLRDQETERGRRLPNFNEGERRCGERPGCRGDAGDFFQSIQLCASAAVRTFSVRRPIVFWCESPRRSSVRRKREREEEDLANSSHCCIWGFEISHITRCPFQTRSRFQVSN